MLRSGMLMVIAILLVTASGLVHGFWTDRWQKSPALQQAMDRLAEIPRSVGDWQGEEVKLERRDMERAGAAAWVARCYQNRATQASVSLFLVCGRAGPVSVHTPEVCYGGTGYETVSPPAGHTVELAGGRSAQLWTTRFRKQESPTQEHLRVFWAWRTTGGDWSAPRNPRLTFARSPSLFKLYVIRQMVSPDEDLETDPALELIRELLPALDRL